MPDVISMGSFGDRRPDILNGLPGAISSGLQVGTEMQKNKILQLIAKNKNITAEDIANNKDITSTTIANQKNTTSLDRLAAKKKFDALKLEKQSEDMNFKHAQKLLEDHTMATAYMDPATKAKYDAEGHGDSINKEIAKGLGISPKDIPELSPIDVIKSSLEKTKVDYINAVRSGKPVNPNLEKAYQALQKHGTDDVALAMHMTASDPSINHSDPKSLQSAIATNLNAIKQARSGQLDSSTQSSNPLSGAISGGQDPNDPMGILKYLKPGSDNGQSN